MKQLKFILFSLILIFSLTVLIKIFFIQVYKVETDSMYKTILSGDKLIISKISRFKTGDIILYKDEKYDQLNLCRLAAQYKDTVTISGQDVFVNNKKFVFQHHTKSYCIRFIKISEVDSLKMKYNLKELNNSGFYQAELTQYEYDEIMTDSVSDLKKKVFPIEKHTQSFFSVEQKINKIVMSKDSVFVLNDNRRDLNDSRTLGLINKKNIVGRVIYIY
ncbi:MAG: signal peptidase I [Bacteroidales bacterium]|nr:signal peptidase I [Bacteroidales bacterium]